MLIELIRRLADQQPKLGFNHRGDVEFAKWAESIRFTVRRLAGASAPLSLRVVSVTELDRNDRLVSHEYLFSASSGAEFRGSLLRPDKEGQYPCVLFCQGRNTTRDEATGAVPTQYADQNGAARFAHQGIATLTLDYGLTHSIKSDLTDDRDEINLIGLASGLIGVSPMQLLVTNALEALRWLDDQPWLLNQQLGIFGRSLGGQIAINSALAFERAIPIALSCCIGHYANMFMRNFVVGAAHSLPDILRFADLPDLVAALAPAPLLVQHGSNDPIMPFSDADLAMKTVREAYDACEALDRLVFQVADRGHGADVDKMTGFLSTNLKTQSEERPAVPPVRIYFENSARSEVLDSVDSALFSGSLTLGEQGKKIERVALERIQSKDVVAVSSGTSALEMSLRVVNVENKPVLLPANTFFATASAILHAGGRPVFVDTEELGLGMCPVALEQRIQEQEDVGAVIVVHIGGVISPELPSIISLCEAHGIPLIEDAAHALGSTLDGLPAGNFGRLAAFSLYPTKIVTSAEGGLIACQEDHDADALRSMRDHGKISFTHNLHNKFGSNWRLSEIHASIGCAHLARLERFLSERAKQAFFYDENLIANDLIRPFIVPTLAHSNYYKYIALLSPRVDRTALKRRLVDRHKVHLSGEIYATRCCDQPYFRDKYSRLEFPNAQAFCEQHICLPVFPTMTTKQQEQVVNALLTEVENNLSS